MIDEALQVLNSYPLLFLPGDRCGDIDVAEAAELVMIAALDGCEFGVRRQPGLVNSRWTSPSCRSRNPPSQ